VDLVVLLADAMVDKIMFCSGSCRVVLGPRRGVAGASLCDISFGVPPQSIS
jgi:hypothetical protein